MDKSKYEEMKINTEFIADNIQLIKELLKYENDEMTYNTSNYARVKFAIDNSIELFKVIKTELEQGKTQAKTKRLFKVDDIVYVKGNVEFDTYNIEVNTLGKVGNNQYEEDKSIIVTLYEVEENKDITAHVDIDLLKLV